MPQIVLTTINARYVHSAFGLRYLFANLGALQCAASIIEFDINDRPIDICETVLKVEPRIVGFGVYIWNATHTLEVVALIRRLAPHVKIILGGPEVSHEIEQQALPGMADYVIAGEADLAFRELCERILQGDAPAERIIHAPLPTLNLLKLPYDQYNDSDIAHRVVYVEASRGCPFTCEFCLSSLDIPVRAFETELFLAEMDKLLSRGVRHFKFVDRTFNLNLRTSKAILGFFLERYLPGLFVHFEMVPDRLPEALKALIAQFPPGTLQFEIGIQSFNPDVGRLISRQQDFEAIESNLRFLRERTGVHLHVDLIAGLPGEDLTSFGRGFDRLVALRPQEIQVGILKRLRGTPITRHTEEWEMVYSPLPPYEVLSTKLIDFPTMQRLKRFARMWDLVGNSGNFLASKTLLWSKANGPFDGMWRFTDFVHARVGALTGISLARLMRLVYDFVVTEGVSADEARAELAADYCRPGRKDLPRWLEDVPAAPPPAEIPEKFGARQLLPRRQSRHLG